MNNRLFILTNQNNQSFLIKANCPEIAMIKAERMGDLGWAIEDELSADKYCYSIMRREYMNNYDELVDILYNYFKARAEDRMLDAYMYADEFENITNKRDHEDIINYVLTSY